MCGVRRGYVSRTLLRIARAMDDLTLVLAEAVSLREGERCVSICWCDLKGGDTWAAETGCLVGLCALHGWHLLFFEHLAGLLPDQMTRCLCMSILGSVAVGDEYQRPRIVSTVAGRMDLRTQLTARWSLG